MITTPAYFVQINFSTVLRLSSRGDQSWDGYAWTGGRLGIVQIGNNGGQIELINTDLVAGALALNEGVTDRAVTVWAFDGDNPASPVLIFSGVGDRLDIGADKVRIALVTENSRTLSSPRRFVNSTAGFNHLLPAGTSIAWAGQNYLLER
ncbi:hypothetical protein [Candidatus Nitrotoga sp. M5]|uniref:hypothetical protein n=1 Tax=Candidatus Nitrotoga sp. M5 TaxID=2890409 RepID=UPI001EF6D320|nr:hypothetical protein [Candidatus Nitrotoga sp. M5]CAH1387016.1 conserved hypothetical protein [Candidatus Nitrotoga sp. M5]